jgi:CheY-like chemotaxis protein
VELAETLPAVRRIPDDDPSALEEGADEASDVVVVVDDQHAGLGHTDFIPRASDVRSARDHIPPVATILIVDPDAANRSLLELLCLRLGHQPIGSREWMEGQEPELMLLEPISGAGVRLARGVRRRFPHLPILCVSIDGPTRDTQELGAVGHVMKPFRRFQLERALQDALLPKVDLTVAGAGMGRELCSTRPAFLPGRPTP